MNLQRGQEGADSGRETDRVSLGSHSKAGALTLSELASPETRGKGWQETEGQGGQREVAHRSGFEGEGKEEDFQMMKENSLAETEEKAEVEGITRGINPAERCALRAPGAVSILGLGHFCPRVFSHNSGHGEGSLHLQTVLVLGNCLLPGGNQGSKGDQD